VKAYLVIKCYQCGEGLGAVEVDTADLPEELQAKVNKLILSHRKHCRYYGRLLVKD
jgi:hypothetical protein